MFLHFILEVINCLDHVSLVFQKRETAFCDIFNELEAAKAVLLTYKER